MADQMMAPDELYTSIPDDADEATKLYMRAQVVIQGAFYALGDRDKSPGEATLGYRQIEEILAMAIAMLVAGNNNLKTKRDVRLEAERIGKDVRAYAEILKDGEDRQAIQILEMLHLRKSSPN